MRLLGRLNRANPFSTVGAIGISAQAFRNKYPELSFRQALERSLIETRPGWSEELFALVEPELDMAETPEQMVDVIVNFEKALRRGRA